MKTQIPINRAKKLHGDGYIFFNSTFEEYGSVFAIVEWTKAAVNGYIQAVPILCKIDPSTLAISFDNGKTWRGIEVYKNIDNVLDTYSKERIKMKKRNSTARKK